MSYDNELVTELQCWNANDGLGIYVLCKQLHTLVLYLEKENELKKFMRRLEDGDTEEVEGKRPTKMPKRHESDFVSDKPKSLKVSTPHFFLSFCVL